MCPIQFQSSCSGKLVAYTRCIFLHGQRSLCSKKHPKTPALSTLHTRLPVRKKRGSCQIATKLSQSQKLAYRRTQRLRRSICCDYFFSFLSYFSLGFGVTYVLFSGKQIGFRLSPPINLHASPVSLIQAL
jgi:hypothetical protein